MTQLKLYAPPHMHAWDFWLINHNDQWHMFHLQAPRKIQNDLRHLHASLGMATSQDLINWTYQGTVLEKGSPGQWDDTCIWSGSIINHQGMYYQFYTSRQKQQGLIQKIGIATSENLVSWKKHPNNPILQADPTWYQTASNCHINNEDWRDPYIYEEQGTYYAFITARTAIKQKCNTFTLKMHYALEALSMLGPLKIQRWYNPSGPLASRGCIALATSTDLINWTIEKPVFHPGDYGCMECPQIIKYNGIYYLSFSTHQGWYTKEHKKHVGRSETGLHVYYASNIRGPYKPVNSDGVVLDTKSGAFGSRFVNIGNLKDPQWVLMSWYLHLPNQKRYCGKIGSPQQVTFSDDQLVLGDFL